MHPSYLSQPDTEPLGLPCPLARVFLTLDQQPIDECSNRFCLLEGVVGECFLASQLFPMFSEFLSCKWKTVYLTAEGERQHLSHQLSGRLEREHEPGLTNLGSGHTDTKEQG